jgi:prevent-host-death family protein
MFQKREAECVISATDAKNNFASVIARVAESGEPVVVERQGKGRAVIVSIDDFRRYRALEDAERRRKAREAMERFQEMVWELNKDLPPLTDEEIEELAQEVRSEVAQSLIEKGIVRYAE